MSDPGRIAFLQQAHRNNWHQYLASLQPSARAGWDICVLTAADQRQAEIYRRQLEWRHEVGLLPAHTRFTVLPDPDGLRIGSGGATLRSLAHIVDADNQHFAGRRVLLIHSGGDSKRLPHCSALGKLFARVPRTLPDGRASTIFDEFLISLSGLVDGLPKGVLVASGDVLLVFDHLQLSFQRGGVVGVAAAAPAEMGQRHGVYVGDNRSHHVRAYLHKPSVSELAHWDATSADGTIQIDTGLVWFDAATADRIMTLASEDAIAQLCDFTLATGASTGARCSSMPMVGLNLYGDLLLPLAESTRYDHYLGDTSDGLATQQVQAARDVIWRHLRGTPFTVERLQPAVFIHFGSSYEYWHMAAGDPELAQVCGWSAAVAAWVDPHLDGDSWPRSDALDPMHHSGIPVLINAAVGRLEVAPREGAIEKRARPARQVSNAASDDRLPALIADSHLEGPFHCRGPAIVANVETSEPLILAADVVIDQLPVVLEECFPERQGFVTRILGLRDDPKRRQDVANATFMNRPWAAWLAEARMTTADLWPDLPPEEHSLWNARLYPLTFDREESLRLALPLQEPASAPHGWRARWLAAHRLSLAESFSQADGGQLLSEAAALEDRIAARRFYTSIEAELPAAQAKVVLGASPATIRRRCDLVGAWLAASDPILQLRGYEALTVASGDLACEDHAFGVLAEMVRQATLDGSRSGQSKGTRQGARRRASGAISADVADRPVRIGAAARIDFGGGWTDTPPHSIERGGTVLNAAVTLHGAYPVVAEAAWLAEPRLILQSWDIDAVIEPVSVGDILAYANPADPFALHKAALVLRGILPAGSTPDTPMAAVLKNRGGGLRLSTGSNIPRGSGLGTSSIMAGAVLECLRRLQEMAADETPTPRQPALLFDEVLCLEQMLTTGGGWQDQAGGLTGGIKLITTEPGLPQRINLRPIHLPPETAAELAERLSLVYTGQQRLAKNLLRHIMARWMARDREIVWILGEIARLAVNMQDALEGGDLNTFGALLGEHWTLNKRMDPGCTNPFIDELFEVMQPYINGGKLAGAGGGGFVIATARDCQAFHELSRALATRYPGTPVGIWPCAVPAEGLRLQGAKTGFPE